MLLLLIFVVFFVCCSCGLAFVSPAAYRSRHQAATTNTIHSNMRHNPITRIRSFHEPRSFMSRALALSLGEYTVSLSKPLGIVLEECEAGGKATGVKVASISEGGAADRCGKILRGDTLLKIQDADVSNSDFDSVMDMLIAAPENQGICLTLGDGLGRMDIAPNLAKKLDMEEAVFADSVVRAAVREIRRRSSSSSSAQGGQLGDLLRVEIVIGAGVRKDGSCMVRFFAIFSRDGVTTFSCSVSATGMRRGSVGEGGDEDNGASEVEIIALSCAKDEGWGQTVDLITSAS